MLRPRLDLAIPWFIVATLIGSGCRTDASVHPSEPTPTPQLDRDAIRSTVDKLAQDDARGRFSLDLPTIHAIATWLGDQYRQAGVRPVGPDYPWDFDITASTTLTDQYRVWIDVEGQNHEWAPETITTLALGERPKPRLGRALNLGPIDAPNLQRDLRRRVAVVELYDPPSIEQTQALAEACAERGAVALLIVAIPNARYSHPSNPWSTWKPLHPQPLPVIGLGPGGYSRSANLVRDTNEQEPPPLVSLAPAEIHKIVRVPNLLATIPGTDLAHEIVVLGAHYDHIGTETFGHACHDPQTKPSEDAICNGADDNASGTAVVLDIARAIMHSTWRPRRTLVFAHFAGEELGLLGSKAFVHHLPNVEPFVDGTIVAMLNLDMIGRYRDDPGLTIFATSSSTGWAPILDQVDPRGLTIHRETSITNRSDHAPFHDRGIPVLFFFTGLHADYHATSDSFDDINLNGITAIGHIVLDILTTVAGGAKLPFQPAQPQDLAPRPLPGA